ncbi:hypothetical protein QO207_22745 [Pseudomonas sp. CAN2814]|jgi:predicted RNA-binding Zn-ribbon protein involved in translation (DUF1610 family)|uniref:hypothetical protein n=1 Tax=Pseudomonas sp. CAN1 TaxID=3046726 RepID=UPI0026491FDE|nr:hypothetical protein [Pseudomonas sp. CAN1]MDN6859423.1 hypothetical protein [Pseudomonas sp. CAN1]
MECYICEADAREIEVEEHLQVECPYCGAYRISHAAARRLGEKTGTFDVPMMQRWVKSYRHLGKLPMLDMLLVSRRLRPR